MCVCVCVCVCVRISYHWRRLGILTCFDSLVSLFNGISTSVGYSMPKLSLLKNSNGTISPTAGRIRKFIPYQRVLVRKGT